MRTTLRTRTDAFTQEFDGELTNIYLAFQVDPKTLGTEPDRALAEAWGRFRSSALVPDIVRDVYLLEARAGGAMSLRRFDPAVDMYDRHLAYVVTEDGVCINTTLVREGLARISARLPLSRLDELRHAEAEAQSFRRGMWGGAPSIPGTGYTPRSGALRSPAPRKRVPSAKRRITRSNKPESKPKP